MAEKQNLNTSVLHQDRTLGAKIGREAASLTHQCTVI
jgi:hypothetical protein